MRYLRNMMFCCLLLTVFLPAAWNKLTFQGYITGSDGNGYTGSLIAGIRILPTTNVDQPALVTRSYPSAINVSDGVYALVLDLDDNDINSIMTKDDLYLAVYLCRTAANNGELFVSANLLTPNIHVLGVPIAFKARGVNVKHVTTSNNEYIGSNLIIGNANNINKPGGIITGSNSRIGIGSDKPAENLHVSADGKTALQVPRIKGDVVNATRVLNVKWE